MNPEAKTNLFAVHSSTPLRVPWRYLYGTLLILALTLGLFYLLLRPPMGDLGLMALFLSVTALFSAAAGFVYYRLGWIERSPSLRLTLLGIYAIVSALAFVNVWVTARLMFASQHDLRLATVLLIFAGGMAMVLGNFLSSALIGRIRLLQESARAIQDGDLAVRIPARGHDELAGLALTFNEMAARLQETERRQRELEILRSDLIAWAGHDLRTPLASVRAIVEALADGVVDDPETVRRYLNTAQRDIQNLSFLIDDMFQIAQLDAGGLPLKRETASLNDLVSDTLESFSRLAAQQEVQLEGNVEAEVDPVFIDVQRIGRALNNLISNALRHTPAGGRVVVRASSLPPEALFPGFAVEVSDTGEGIAPEDQAHIFERFYRGEKSRRSSAGGAGLGLAIVRSIVEAHGGQVSVESKPGEGACFRIVLPNSKSS